MRFAVLGVFLAVGAWAASWEFAWTSQKILSQKDATVVFSPHSCRQVLKLFYEARGATPSPLESLCGFSSQEAPLKSKGWKSVEHIFLDRRVEMVPGYQGPFSKLDFAQANAYQEVNRWVDTQTEHKITELLTPRDVNSETVLVALNAIYLKAPWSVPFQPDRTTREEWFPRGEVAMMHGQMRAGLIRSEDYSLLELPMGDGQLVFDCLLPTRLDGLGAVRAKLDGAHLAELWNQLESEVQSVEVGLPRLKLQSHHDLLSSLDIPRQLDLSRMLSGPTQISVFYQMARLDLDEKGVEAGAASAGVVSRSMPERFVADHPFMFWIRERSQGAVLFSGQYYGP